MPAGNSAAAPPPQRSTLIAAICLAILPTAIAYGFMYHFSRNLPVLDDYHAILDFSLHYLSLTGSHEKLLYFFSAQHNDYKLVTQQAIVLAQLHLIHCIDFSFLILLGNLLLLPIAGLLWKIYFRHEWSLERRVLLFVPIAWVFWGLNYAETVNFPISGLQIQAVILFSMWSLYLLAQSLEEKGQGRFLLAIVAAIVACLTYANAFLVAPVGLLVLLPRRMYGRAAIWCIAFVLPLVPFLYHRQSSSHFALKSLPMTLLFFLSFLGSGTLILPLGVAFGLGIMVVFCLSVRARYDRKNPAAFLVSSWILLTGAVVTWGRVGGGFWVSHSSRYRLYSDLLFIYCYAYLAQRVAESARPPEAKRKLYRYALVCGLLFGALSDVYGWVFLKHRVQELETGMAQYRAEPALRSPLYFTSQFNQQGSAAAAAAARVTLGQATAAGIYRPPPVADGKP